VPGHGEELHADQPFLRRQPGLHREGMQVGDQRGDQLSQPRAGRIAVSLQHLISQLGWSHGVPARLWEICRRPA
jgi:hypothetical protein